MNAAWFHPILQRLDAAWERALARHARAVTGRQALHVQSYLGYARPGMARSLGRVLFTKAPPWDPDADPLQNAGGLLTRILQPAAPGVGLELCGGAKPVRVSTDSAGRWDACVPLADQDLSAEEWDLSVTLPGAGSPMRSTAKVLAPASSSSFGVISDIDDTIVQSEVSDPFRFFFQSLTRGPFARRPVPGASALYRALAAGIGTGECNPFFYVSGTAWELYDLLVLMLDHFGFPRGHLRLKDVRRGYGPEPRGHQVPYKTRHMTRILDFFPDLPFVLLGDSGEDDPAVYARLMTRYPERILGVMIRRARRLERTADSLRKLEAEARKQQLPICVSDRAGELHSFATSRGWTLGP